MVDAGLSIKEISARLGAVGASLDSVTALFVTHEHVDHTKSVGSLARRLGIPVFLSGGTADCLERDLHDIETRVIEAGKTIEFASIKISVFGLSHDAAEPVGYSFIVDDYRVSFITDTGMISDEVFAELDSARIAFIEANHDVDRLLSGPYPWFLKRRISSARGHLSNLQAAETIGRLNLDLPKIVMLSHLSANNNSPAQAFKIVKEEVSVNDSLKIGIAYRGRPGTIVGLQGGEVVWKEAGERHQAVLMVDGC